MWTENFQMYKLGLEKAQEPEGGQTANISWIMENAKQFQKNIYFCFIDHTKVFDCIDHNRLWTTLKETGVSDHLICLLRNLYAGQEAAVRTGHETRYWLKIRKVVWQRCILSPCLSSFCAVHIMWNAGLNESQAWIKISGRNSNLRGSDDTTLMAESEEELRSLLMRVKEESEKTDLNLNIQKNKIRACSPITSWWILIEGEKVGAVIDFIFLGSKIPVDSAATSYLKSILHLV